MRFPMINSLLASIASFGICGCATTSDQRENLDAVLWVQTSSEFAAATIGTYAAATAALQRIADDSPTGTDRMAVVMDVDATILDGYSYQAQNIVDDVGYQADRLDQWFARREEVAIPGAVEFVAASQDLGVDVFFITNRPCTERPNDSGYCPQKEDTLAGLRHVGVNTDAGALLLRGERVPAHCLSFLSDLGRQQGRWAASDKTFRRQCVETNHDIVMLIGDQLVDFIGGLEETTPESRKVLLAQYKENWGNTWFMIPNPTYGSWLDLLQPDKRSHLR